MNAIEARRLATQNERKFKRSRYAEVKTAILAAVQDGVYSITSQDLSEDDVAILSSEGYKVANEGIIFQISW